MFRKSDLLVKNKIVRTFLIVAGSVSVALGFLGIFIPLLPTTPFLLLAAACYIRSSERFYQWLMTNRYLGRYISDYREKRGMKLRSKLLSISLMWITILFSIIFATENLLLRIILAVIAISVTIHLLRLRTLR